MFEPLQAILNKHGDTFAGHLAGIRSSLAAVASNTEAQLSRDQATRKSVQVEPGKTEQLRNDSAYGWRVRWIANSGPSDEIEIYLGVESDEGFMLYLEGKASKEVNWFVPLNGVIFIHNGEEPAEESDLGAYVNFEIDVLVTEAAEARTGPSDERIEVERRESTPSGTPLDDRVVDRPMSPLNGNYTP